MFEITVDEVKNIPPVTILRLEGSFDTAAQKIFEPKVAELISQGARDFLIDLSGLTIFSSIGIRALSMLYYKLHPDASGADKESVMEGIRTGEYTAPHLKLLKPSKDALRVLETTGLSMVLVCFDDEQEALESFR